MTRLINTDKKEDLKRFAQALMLINYARVLNLKEITLLEFGGNKIVVDYLLFSVGNITYQYRNNEFRVYEVDYSKY